MRFTTSHRELTASGFSTYSRLAIAKRCPGVPRGYNQSFSSIESSKKITGNLWDYAIEEGGKKDNNLSSIDWMLTSTHWVIEG